MAKELKITLLPSPGSASYDQHTHQVDETFEFDVLDGEQWLQFEDTNKVSYALPMQRIVALALRQL